MKPAPAKFSSPSALREFALETAAEFRRTGLGEAGDIMESAAKFVTSSGWEWLGELGQAAKIINRRFDVPQMLAVRVSRIAEAATCRHPYG